MIVCHQVLKIENHREQGYWPRSLEKNILLNLILIVVHSLFYIANNNGETCILGTKDSQVVPRFLHHLLAHLLSKLLLSKLSSIWVKIYLMSFTRSPQVKGSPPHFRGDAFALYFLFLLLFGRLQFYVLNLQHLTDMIVFPTQVTLWLPVALWITFQIPATVKFLHDPALSAILPSTRCQSLCTMRGGRGIPWASWRQTSAWAGWKGGPWSNPISTA